MPNNASLARTCWLALLDRLKRHLLDRLKRQQVATCLTEINPHHRVELLACLLIFLSRLSRPLSEVSSPVGFP